MSVEMECIKELQSIVQSLREDNGKLTTQVNELQFTLNILVKRVNELTPYEV